MRLPTLGTEIAAMTVMLSKLYAALKAAGTPEQEARAAAEELGNMHEQFGGMRWRCRNCRAT